VGGWVRAWAGSGAVDGADGGVRQVGQGVSNSEACRQIGGTRRRFGRTVPVKWRSGHPLCAGAKCAMQTVRECRPREPSPPPATLLVAARCAADSEDNPFLRGRCAARCRVSANTARMRILTVAAASCWSDTWDHMLSMSVTSIWPGMRRRFIGLSIRRPLPWLTGLSCSGGQERRFPRAHAGILMPALCFAVVRFVDVTGQFRWLRDRCGVVGSGGLEDRFGVLSAEASWTGFVVGGR
jgi:hypothetical protein